MPVNGRMPGQKRDNQRKRLYDAERIAWPDTEEVPAKPMSVAECQALVDKIVGSRWWNGRYYLVTPPLVKAGQGARWATARHGEHTIVLPLWARKPHVIIHELAHYAVKSRREGWGNQSAAHHGPEFAREYLAMINRWMGKEEGAKLKAAFKEKRVKYTLRNKRV